MKRGILICLVVSAGCVADLKRVHTPDLLTVDEHRAAKLARRVPSEVAAHVVSAKECWQLHSSLLDPMLMVDGNDSTQAISGDPQRRDQFVLIDLRQVCKVQQVIQFHAAADGHPKRYRVDVAGEHNFPYTLTYIGGGECGQSRAVFAKPVECRFLRITLLEPSEATWDIAELEIR